MIEVLHIRDPDYECYMRVWVDGKEVPPSAISIEDIDPGRGYDAETWEERIEEARVDTSPFGQACLAALEANKDSKWNLH